ncbi:MAG: 3-hydroxyacyl-ACP dehydratase FabZ family protein [Planctomycetota bacterium]
MTDPGDIDKLVKRARKKPIMAADAGVAVAYDASVVERLLPHRPPFRFVDSIERVDPAGGFIAGSLTLRGDDPVFAGHFPGYPVWPGVLQIEAIGQLGICLAWFVRNARTDVTDDAAPLDVRALKVLQAHFVGEIRPGDTVTLLAQALASDGFGGISLGQCLVGDRVCSVAVGEVYYPDETA